MHVLSYKDIFENKRKISKEDIHKKNYTLKFGTCLHKRKHFNFQELLCSSCISVYSYCTENIHV